MPLGNCYMCKAITVFSWVYELASPNLGLQLVQRRIQANVPNEPKRTTIISTRMGGSLSRKHLNLEEV